MIIKKRQIFIGFFLLISLLSLHKFYLFDCAFLYFDVFSVFFVFYQLMRYSLSNYRRGENKFLKNLLLLLCGLWVSLFISYLHNGYFDYPFLGRVWLLFINVFALVSLMRVYVKNYEHLLDVNNIVLVILTLLVVNNYKELIFTEGEIYLYSFKSTVGAMFCFTLLRFDLHGRFSVYSLLLLLVMNFLLYPDISRSLIIGVSVFFLIYAFRQNRKIFVVLSVFYGILYAVKTLFYAAQQHEVSDLRRYYMTAIPFIDGDLSDYLFGMGIQSWRIILMKFGDVFDDGFLDVANPHNFIVELFIRGGILLVLLFGFILVKLLWNSRTIPTVVAGLISAFLGTMTGYERYIVAVLFAYAIISIEIGSNQINAYARR